MDNLILSSKILYDRDTLEKNKQIRILKYKLDGPKIKYNNIVEWEKAKQNLLNNIKIGIFESIVEDDYEYRVMLTSGLTTKQVLYLQSYLNEELFNLTHNTKYSYDVSYKIIESIKIFFNSLYNCNKWTEFIHNMSPEKMSSIIKNNIENQLLSETNYSGYLYDIVLIKCSYCNKYNNLSFINNICNKCYNDNYI